MTNERPLLEVLEELSTERKEWYRKTGHFLRAAREELQLTQSAFAELAGVPQSYLSNVENGRGSFSTDQLDKFRELLADPSLKKRSASGNQVKHRAKKAHSKKAGSRN